MPARRVPNKRKNARSGCTTLASLVPRKFRLPRDKQEVRARKPGAWSKVPSQAIAPDRGGPRASVWSRSGTKLKRYGARSAFRESGPRSCCPRLDAAVSGMRTEIKKKENGERECYWREDGSRTMARMASPLLFPTPFLWRRTSENCFRMLGPCPRRTPSLATWLSLTTR